MCLSSKKNIQSVTAQAEGRSHKEKKYWCLAPLRYFIALKRCKETEEALGFLTLSASPSLRKRKTAHKQDW